LYLSYRVRLDVDFYKQLVRAGLSASLLRSKFICCKRSLFRDSSLCGVLFHDVEHRSKDWLDRCAAHEEAIQVSLLDQVGSISLGNTSSEHNAGVSSHCFVNVVLQPGSDFQSGVLDLVRTGDHLELYRPDWLIDNHNFSPVLNVVVEGVELLVDDGHRVVIFVLLFVLSDAINDSQLTLL